MRIRFSHIQDGEETISLRMTRFLMACNGCILVSISLSLPRVGTHGRGDPEGRRGTVSKISLQAALFQRTVKLLNIQISLFQFLSSSKPPMSPANTPRRRYANNNKPHPLASNRRCHLPSTRLVPRPRHRLLLHEHGFRHRRSRQWSPKHVVSHGARLSDRWAFEKSLPRIFLSAAGTATE